MNTKYVVVIVGVVIVETKRLGPLGEGFPSKHYHTANVSSEDQEKLGLSTESLLPHCHSVMTPLQPVLYGVWLLSATEACRGDGRVELVGVGVWPARSRLEVA